MITILRIKLYLNSYAISERTSPFTQEDKKSIMDLVDEYCNPELYLKRFKLMLSSIERKLFRYDQKLDLTKYRIDIPKSICEC